MISPLSRPLRAASPFFALAGPALPLVFTALGMLAPAALAAAAPKLQRVTVGAQYAAGGFHRAMLGASYRALWTTPIEVEELWLADAGGGLQPVRRVGGQQTKGLALKGADGRSYTFRAIDKDPSNILPEELQDTFVDELVRDQMAAQHPASPVITDELSKAVGVATVPVRIMVMADDPALGEFRKDFAHLVGTFFEYPSASDERHKGFEDAVEILDHKALYAKLAASPDDRIEVRELLKARLFDVFLSDFDRHRKQWRWARRAEGRTWHPIPEDRDQAFARYEGLLVRTAAGFVPQLRTFGKGYDRIFGLTYNGREQDRWLLTGFALDTWREVAVELKAALTDEVIERAARRMPPEWYALDGQRLVAALQARRETLPREAERFYRHLAGQVDARATAAAEEARVVRSQDGSVDVRIARLDPAGASETPYYQRRFVAGETSDLRLYMGGGNDRVLVEGPRGPIRLRVVGGAGNLLLDDSKGGGTTLYDSQGQDRVVAGPGTSWDRRPWVEPPGPKGAEWITMRDWGRDWYGLPWLSFGSDSGLFLGAGVVTKSYGFRKQPFSAQHTLRFGWAFGAQQPRATYDGEFHLENTRAFFGLHASYSGLSVQRYFGFGNETVASQDDDFSKVRQRTLALSPWLSLPLAGKLRFVVAPALEYSKTEEGLRRVNLDEPYGSGSFGQVGGRARLQLDTRGGLRQGPSSLRLPGSGEGGGYPVRGVFLEAEGAVWPKAWDVDRTYGWLQGSAATYLSAGGNGRATLALRAGGRQMLGERYPFQDAASVGGGDTFSGQDALRGLQPNRYIGDKSAYGNAELRLYLSRFFLALPGEWGLFGFGDVGRVWLDKEASDTWHTTWGAGLWFGLLSRSNAIALTWAHSEERNAFYVRAGFSY